MELCRQRNRKAYESRKVNGKHTQRTTAFLTHFLENTKTREITKRKQFLRIFCGDIDPKKSQSEYFCWIPVAHRTTFKQRSKWEALISTVKGQRKVIRLSKSPVSGNTSPVFKSPRNIPKQKPSSVNWNRFNPNSFSRVTGM